MKIPQQHPLNLQFKGDRDYIHGTDIYNAINNIAPELLDNQDAFLSKLVFRSFSRHDCDLCLLEPPRGQRLIATGTIVSRLGGSKRVWIVESNRPVKGRYDFDESLIVSPAIFQNKSIRLKVKSIYSPIEELIALTKKLSYNLCPDVSGKWVFGQLDLLEPLLRDREELRVDQISLFADRFTLNHVYQNQTRIGEIRFITGNP